MAGETEAEAVTDDKIREALDRYERVIVDRYDYPSSSGVPPALAHALTMIPKMREMIVTTESIMDNSATPLEDAIPVREKLMRWLGFLQGVLFAFGVYTIDEMRA
jgi:hypothetical protein